MNTVNRIAGFVALVSMTGLAFGAAITGDAPQRAVSYADLDLNRKAGAATLYFRIKAAARDVCGSQLGRELAMRTNYDRCVDEAIGRAVADVDAPALITVYREAAMQ